MSPKELAQRVQQLLHPKPVPKQVVIETAATYAIPHQDLDKFSIDGQVGSIKVVIHYEIVKEQQTK
jgi:hypothetical protein